MTSHGLLHHIKDNVGHTSVLFLDYWLSLDKVDYVPSRTDFDPMDVPQLLPHIIIHELVSPTFLKLRLVGTAVVREYGQEMTGRNYLDFVEPDRREAASRSIHLVCAHPCGMLVKAEGLSKNGLLLQRESIALPLRDSDGTARFVYFCSTQHERSGSLRSPSEPRLNQVHERRYFDIGAGIPKDAD